MSDRSRLSRATLTFRTVLILPAANAHASWHGLANPSQVHIPLLQATAATGIKTAEQPYLCDTQRSQRMEMNRMSVTRPGTESDPSPGRAREL